MKEQQGNDPLQFMKQLWGNMGFSLPGMVAPTFDEEDLDKRIHDLKAVEGWLRMNLSMLQMTIQGLEMQQSTLKAVRAMGQMGAAAGNDTATSSTAGFSSPEPGAAAAGMLWPWDMMREMQEQMGRMAEAAQAAQAPVPGDAAPAKGSEAGDAAQPAPSGSKRRPRE